MNFNNKVVVLTGASSGIGYQLAKLLPKENCSVALLARSKEILDDLVENQQSENNRMKAYRCDVSNQKEVKSTFEEIKKDFSRIDIVILNAGISSRTSIKNFSVEKAEDIFNVNVLGIVYCIEQVLKDFIEKKEGMIVGISSLAESRGFPRSGFYNGSKAAVTLLLESLRVELKKFNIKVLTVKPGFVRTPMTDKNEFQMPFLMNVEKAASIILKGIKKEKKIIQFPLPIVIGSKIFKFVPNWLFDHLMSKELPSRKDTGK
jgi:short-subunit dehydrogenase